MGTRPDPRIRTYGDRMEMVPGITLIRCGGHFDGSAVLHWAAGVDGRGALFTGDTITVVMDRDYVSFMWSCPNLVPLDRAAVMQVVERVQPFPFDRIHGGRWDRVVATGAQSKVRLSADRYLRFSGRPPSRPQNSSKAGASSRSSSSANRSGNPLRTCTHT